jgi:hypothetical protein
MPGRIRDFLGLLVFCACFYFLLVFTTGIGG